MMSRHCFTRGSFMQGPVESEKSRITASVKKLGNIREEPWVIRQYRLSICVIKASAWVPIGWKIRTLCYSPRVEPCPRGVQAAAPTHSHRIFAWEIAGKTEVAETTGLEPATSALTGQRSNQLNYASARRETISR